MSRQNDIDKLQAEIVGAYRNFKPTGETRRIVDKAYTDLESADARIASLEARIHEAIEVYAGMEGFIPKTAPEAYCLRIIDQMNKALLGGGDGPKDL